MPWFCQTEVISRQVDGLPAGGRRVSQQIVVSDLPCIPKAPKETGQRVQHYRELPSSASRTLADSA